MTELQRLMQAKESLRIQQAKSKWIKAGDANTSFFHGVVERRGRIKGMKGDGGKR